MKLHQTSAMLRLVSLTLLFFALAGIVFSHDTQLARSPNIIKEFHDVPSHWSRKGPAPPNHMLNLHIGLKQTQMDALERHLYEGKKSLVFFMFRLTIHPSFR